LIISTARRNRVACSHLSAIKGESKCHDCYMSGRHK
jgi:hypothetical protein